MNTFIEIAKIFLGANIDPLIANTLVTLTALLVALFAIYAITQITGRGGRK